MSRAVKVGIFGSSGRMGQRLCALSETRPDLELVCRIDTNTIEGEPSDCDVMIDFSVANATEQLLAVLKTMDAGLVTGVTGRTDEQHAAITELASHRPVFSAANFSLGIAVLNQLVAMAAEALRDDFDCEVFEIHHRMKADAPSGTALQLAQTAAQTSGIRWPDGRRVREGNTSARGTHEVGTAAIRGGRVAGEHTVYFLGDSERLELTHRATDRDVFVVGALKAAKWLSGQKPGLYSMVNMLPRLNFSTDSVC